MAQEKAPAFQFYPKEFLTDGNVAGMSLQERGAYITLICLCWQEQSLPSDTGRLANMVGLPQRYFLRLWPALSKCFHEQDGRLVHPRLEIERQKQSDHRHRQSDKGKAGAAARWPDDGTGKAGPVAQAIPDRSSPISDLHTLSGKEHQREKSASLSPPADDPFLNQQTGDRAAAFLDRYEVLYRTHRKGARYARKPVRDYAAAVTLCHTWADDGRLDKLAIIFLTTDHKFADEGSRTVPQFLGLASWCDGKLADWEAKKASA